MKPQQFINLTFGICLLAMGTVVSLLYLDKSETVYIEIGEVYQEFEMRKELDAQLTQVQSSRKYVLDSLGLQLKTLANTYGQQTPTDAQAQQFEVMKNDYLLREQQYNRENEQLVKSYNDQIWKQLNEFIAAYGKENKIDFIYGASGSGNIMHAEKEYDVTQDIISYVNNKYEGEG